ncbi:MAG: peptidoglycan DD-metalloendopeptidase family protein, partial [Gemmatimonadetes bacterium]|nr:peptidoglycan DD-metalloendopeptidase family protein [Gemmatimonadota bacterium]
RSVLAELDFQAEATAERIRGNNGELLRTRERLAEGSAILQRRLRDIYKLGSLHTVRVLLGAESFSDLLNRYRYLRLVANYDRSLVQRVEELEQGLVRQNRDLRESLAALGALRQNKLSEVAELRSVEDEHQRTLEEYRSREQRATTRLEQLEEDAQRMVGLVDELERRRVEAERRRASAGARTEAASMASGDAGSLLWPVEGGLLYRFGRERRPNGTVLRWNGIGIAADPGTPVRAVREGTVVLAGPFEGYGPTVVLSHGNGFYTLYLYLEDIGVVEGRRVEAGQVVGTVGGTDTPEGPHIEFQVRAPLDGGAPQAQDPLLWLRSRGGP